MFAEESTQIPVSVIRPLVVGTEPIAGECLSSVLVRSCEANVFTKTAHLLSLIGLRAQASEAVPFTHTSSASALAKLLGTTAEEIASRMHPAIHDKLGRSTIVNWFGSHIERRYVEAKVRRFAPHSLEEREHIPAIWGARLLDYCPATMEYLLSDCPQCFRPLGWRGCQFLAQCEKCGASLLRAVSRTLPPHLHEDARLGAALVSPIPTARQSALSSLPYPFSTWGPSDALVGLLTLGEAQLAVERPGHSSGKDGAAANIAAGIQFVRDWPESMSRYAKESTVRSNSASVRLGLGPLGKLFESSATRTPIRDLIRSTVWTSLGNALMPAKLFSGRTVNVVRRHGMLTTLEATKQLGIDTKRLRRLEGRSETFLGRHNVRGGLALYDEAAISRLQSVLRQSVKPNVAARQLGIPSYCIKAFISAGLVKVVTDQDANILVERNLITKASMVALRERFQKESTKVEGDVTLRHAMRRNGDPQDWVAVFRNILSGGIALQVNDSDDTPLTDASIVKYADIERHVSRRSNGPGISGIEISCQTAARIVGTKPMFVSDAVKIGLLVGEVRGRDYALRLEHVLKFQRDFVVGEELREIFGGHQRSICCQLDGAGIKSAGTINHTRVWHRSDIEMYAKYHDSLLPTGCSLK